MTNNTLRNWKLEIGKWTYTLLLFSFLLFPFLLSAQTTSQTSFGKNRVQYNRQIDEWMVYETANFVTYWYGDARNIAQSALQMAEYDFSAAQQSLEHTMTDKIEMLVFCDLTDLKQSNIGEDEVFQIRVGETKVVGNKVFVYFDGDHNHLRAQIREGVAAVLINSMLFGSNLQEIVQNAVLLNLPGWYTNGLSAYVGEEWSVTTDNQLRDLIQLGKYKNFDQLAKEHPRTAGHAFWNYIGLHFGRGTVSNLLYLTRINRSMDAGFLYVLGNGYRNTTDAMMDYYKKRYREEAKVTKTPDTADKIAIKNKKKLPLSQVRISPDGQRVAWVSNDLGKWRVWVKELGKKDSKPKLVLKGGARNALQTTDYNYPQLAWNPDNQRLAVLYERRDIPRFAFLDFSGKKIKKEVADLSPEFQRVFSMDYVNPVDIAFSGAVRGYSDLFVYHTVTKQTERLTQDFWDDLDAAVATLDGRKGLLFSSNRPNDTLAVERLDTILPIGRFDVFFFDLESRNPELIRITQTPMFDERRPIGVDSAHFAFLSDENGIFNRHAGYLEPYLAYNQAVIYLKDGAEVKALDDKNPGEWPLERILAFLAPLDTVLKNIDSTQIDSIRFSPVFKKRARSWNLTNYDRNIAEHHISFRTGRMVESVPRDGKTVFYTKKIDPLTVAPARITRYRELTYHRAGLRVPPQPDIEDSSQAPEKQPANLEKGNLRDSILQIPSGWFFQMPEYLTVAPPPTPQKEPAPAPAPAAVEEKAGVVQLDSVPAPRRPVKPGKPLVEMGKNNTVIRFNPSQIIPYRLKFRTDYVSTSLDNNLLFEGLNPYNGVPNDLTPPVGILLRANFKDLLENYVVEAGFRLPTTFDGAEYYVWLDDKKRRWDKRYALYRKTQVKTLDETTPGVPAVPLQTRTNTVLGQYELRYPLDMFFSLRGTATLRQDKTIFLSTNEITLGQPDYAEQRASLRLAAVYDNTLDVDINLKTGSRAKFFVEAVKRFELNFQPDWSFKFNNGFMTVIGLDARHYQLLDRRSILALRFAASTSFGSEKILYTLGGVDNWIFSEYNTNIPQPQGDDFAYQAIATNLRGFKQNIRNGNSYALLNSELRVPIFKYFSTKPVMGNFWRNFQLVGFFDVGTAWQGKDPYDGDNPINIVYLFNPPTVAVRVNYFRDPLVAGYGFGARALIFGMYIRADYAWGIETREIQKPIFYFALGTDF